MALIVTSMLFRHGKLHNQNSALVGVGVKTIRLNDAENIPSYANAECMTSLSAEFLAERAARIEKYRERAAQSLPLFN